MNTKCFSILITSSVVFVLSLATCLGQTKSKQPNLLFIFPDQLRNAAVGANKEDPVVTPNIDQLVAKD